LLKQSPTSCFAPGLFFAGAWKRIRECFADEAIRNIEARCMAVNDLKLITAHCMNDRIHTLDRTIYICGSREAFRNSHNTANNDAEKLRNLNPQPSLLLAGCSSFLPFPGFLPLV
jgi:hypothetical protein